MARMNRVAHKGVQLFHLDLHDLKPGEFKPVFAEATRVLAACPPKSAKVVTDVSGARFDAATLVEFERFIRDVMPHLAANAIVGVDLDYEVLGQNNGMLMVSASGTAVCVK